MADIRVHVGPGNMINLKVDDQHLSRLTVGETVDLMVQVLVFSKPVRQQIKHWLRDGGEVETVGDFLGAGKDNVGITLSGKQS
jgi:hypothetical protein